MLVCLSWDIELCLSPPERRGIAAVIVRACPAAYVVGRDPCKIFVSSFPCCPVGDRIVFVGKFPSGCRICCFLESAVRHPVTPDPFPRQKKKKSQLPMALLSLCVSSRHRLQEFSKGPRRKDRQLLPSVTDEGVICLSDAARCCSRCGLRRHLGRCC